jgi:chromosome condensin MukBEF complex kleisin-like MukF subunit
MKRAKRNFAKRTLLLWYFDCKIRGVHAYHQQEISQAFESIDLERHTMNLEKQSMEDELEETSNRLDDALQEIEELIETNHVLSDQLQKMPSQDCEVQTDKSGYILDYGLILML